MDVPPERIVLGEVGAALRRHRVADLDALHAVIEESRDHLRPWMPWADQARQDTATFLAAAVSQWDAGTDFGFLIVEADDDDDVLGGTGLHARRGPAAMEIGYWRRHDAGGRGLVTASSGALTELVLTSPGMQRVEIRCDEANTASAAVPRRLGFALERLEDRPLCAPGERGRDMVWARHRPPEIGDARH